MFFIKTRLKIDEGYFLSPRYLSLCNLQQNLTSFLICQEFEELFLYQYNMTKNCIYLLVCLHVWTQSCLALNNNNWQMLEFASLSLTT